MQDDLLWAHVRTDAATGAALPHRLDEHLREVARRAQNNADAFAGDWAYLAGLWHDLGKFRPGFQRYIRVVGDAHIEGKLPPSSEKTHSAAGALHAMQEVERAWGPRWSALGRVLAYVIAGHHVGLGDWVTSVGPRLLGTGASDSQREYQEALAASIKAAPAILQWPPAFDLQRALAPIPGPQTDQPLTLSLWIRMLFSALVDADFLDTEQFMDAGKAQRRGGLNSLSWCRDRLTQHLDDMAASSPASCRGMSVVMQARGDVLRQCRDKGVQPGGVFALTVPTGGGKTLSSLSFALEHAVAHRKRRVIYAIPYTSIIEQTADVFGAIFGADQVIEHHSQTDTDDKNETPRSRLAAENWDAPLIVTTNVQLFESLFAARTSRCRKLHNIAGSVIVLDEAQLLPPEFLQPILDALNALVTHFGVTLLLCTATQPALGESRRFDPRQTLRGLPLPVRIIENEASLFKALRRVKIEWPTDLHANLPTPALVTRLVEHECVLVVVNTRKDAAEIMTALDSATSDRALHLSAAMCGQHRADVIAEIRARLAARRSGADLRPLRVVSTQLVEAGVDIDFPVVFRALAGLDSVAQAAGRCNREGQLPDGEMGQVVVFVRAIPKTLHALRNGADSTRSVLQSGVDALSPDAFERYFPLYYACFASRDKHGIVDHLKKNPNFEFEFRAAADKFKLVDDEAQATVIVDYAGARSDSIEPFIQRLRQGDTDRWLLRKLQRYTVSVRKNLAHRWAARGDALELGAGTHMYVLIDALRYDGRLGLLPDDPSLDPVSLVA